MSSANAPTDVLVVTGMSGAGRSTVARVLEDEGWFVMDNVLPQMLGTLTDHLQQEGSASGVPIRAAAVVDVRSRAFFGDLAQVIRAMRAEGRNARIVFLDATDETLVRRFESVRRPHPLQASGRLLDGILKERELLGPVRMYADLIVDTTGLSIHDLARKIAPIFRIEGAETLTLAVTSFGFKYGIPLDADFVFDLRFLPNPFWIPELRPLRGTDAPVADYVMSRPGAQEFLDRSLAMLDTAISGYLREQRRYAMVGIGCTGGKHRSVAFTEALAARLNGPDVRAFAIHRDLGHE